MGYVLINLPFISQQFSIRKTVIINPDPGLQLHTFKNISRHLTPVDNAGGYNFS